MGHDSVWQTLPQSRTCPASAALHFCQEAVTLKRIADDNEEAYLPLSWLMTALRVALEGEENEKMP